MIGASNTLTSSSQRSHYFDNSIKNDSDSLQPIISALRDRQNLICELCGKIGHKSDYCIIRGTKFLQLSPGIKMNQYNPIHGNEPPGLQQEWNSKPP